MSSPAGAELHQMASIGRLLTGIVHEINSPLASIFSNNEVSINALENVRALIADPTSESLERARKLIESCQTLASVDKIACERIRSIIRGLKTFSRVDTPETRKVDLNEHLRDTLKLTQADFRRRIAVETDFGELPEVECYPQMLNQVFLNVLVNAGQAIEGEGKIAVSTRLEGADAHITIADTGRGMTPEQKARAFEGGFTTKPVGEGAGFGLHIAREIVEDRHGGSITFDSEPGKGTEFHIRIPVRRQRSEKQ